MWISLLQRLRRTKLCTCVDPVDVEGEDAAAAASEYSGGATVACSFPGLVDVGRCFSIVLVLLLIKEIEESSHQDFNLTGCLSFGFPQTIPVIFYSLVASSNRRSSAGLPWLLSVQPSPSQCLGRGINMLGTNVVHVR